jgi:FKBP-type peptidyl-prolyl cis-trans isomerase SlpA
VSKLEQSVGPGDTILLHYQLSSPDGTEFENTFDDEPVELTLGQGELAWNLEQCLIGLPLNERHVFMLEPAQAFGCFDERLVQRLALTDFPADMALAPQMMIEFQLPNGTTMPGTIQEIGQSEVVVDFNHPLSDCPVHFEVEVLKTIPGKIM